MHLNPTDLITLSRLLDEAMDLEPAQAEAWLAALPEEHAHLRPKLEEMLTANRADSDPGFMADGPKLAGPFDETVARADELIGPYRLIREIGHGGMGTVWLAERADGAYKRNVALKLPRLAWGVGLAARMTREREIGMLLEHPNIARMYDAGVDERGRPYLALEYIDGQPIDTWCEAQALSIRDRLKLFVQVVRAVAYAHGRLVVHRDLKPSNVLVSVDGQAHLLDFGIAKLLLEAGPVDDHLTQEQGRVLTPRYASPEQIKGETITVSSDVYSLGVLLYELLTGRYPYEPQNKSMAAIEKAIVNDEPALASSWVRDKATVKGLRGEIDAILAKALKREPSLRYATAYALADDVERHLKGDAIVAQPDSALYRLRKSVRRHRVGIGAGSAVLIATLGGAGASLVQANRASEAAERTRVVKEFVVDIFKINSPGNGNAELRTLPARMLLDRGAKLIETKFAGQASLQAELYGVVGGIFLDMGAPEVADEYATKQLATLAATNARPREQANALLLLAQVYFDSKRYRDAELRIRRAMMLSDDDPELKVHAQVMLAGTLERLGRIADCKNELAAVEEALRRRARGPSIDRANAMKLRATLLTNDNRFNDAIPVLAAAVDEALASEGALSRTAIDIRIGLAREFVQRFRLEESRVPSDAALSALRALGGAGQVRAALEEAQLTMNAYENHLIKFDVARDVVQRDRVSIAAMDSATPESILARIDLYLGWLEFHWGNVAEAERLISTAAARLRPDVDALVDRYQLTLGLAAVAQMTGRHDQADALYGELAKLRRQMGRGNNPFAAEDYASIAENLGMQGRYAQALGLLAAAPTFDRVQGMATEGEKTEELIDVVRARLVLDAGDPKSALRLLPKTQAQMTTFSDGQQRIRGEAMCTSGSPAEGLATLLSVIEFYAPDRYEFDAVIARDRAVAGLCALAMGRAKDARQLATQARAAFVAQPNVSPYFKAALLELERALGLRLQPV